MEHNPNYLSNVHSFHVHPHHHSAIVAHAVRNIPGADKLLKEIKDRSEFKKTRPDDDRQDYDDNLKDHLG